MHIARLRRDPNVTLIAVTGGPCGGKTSFMARARAFLEDHGFRVAILTETATEIITAGFSPNPADWRNPMDFQEFILNFSLDREHWYLKYLSSQTEKRPLILLVDRGLIDGMAYVGRSQYLRLLDTLGIEFAHLMSRYAGAIHLVTAADGAEAHYTLSNNKARSETPDEARALDIRTREAWHGHSHFVVIDNRTDFDAKMTRALQGLARLIGIPEPLEQERRFKVLNFSPSLVPKSAVPVEIVQDYLISTGPQRRVRKRTLDGIAAYYYTEKRPGKTPGVRFEIDRLIALHEYEALLREKDPKGETLEKTRYCFVHAGHYVELDVFKEPLRMRGNVYAEIEVSDLSEHVELPASWNVVDVTDIPGHSNYDAAYATP